MVCVKVYSFLPAYFNFFSYSSLYLISYLVMTVMCISACTHNVIYNVNSSMIERGVILSDW